MKTLQKWLMVGVAEIAISLSLLAIAPIFLNSSKPAIGFAIWFAIPTVLGGSGWYAAGRLADAQKARTLFLKRFPEYEAIGFAEFLEIPSQQVIESLEMLEAIENDSDFKALDISLFEFLKGTSKR